MAFAMSCWCCVQAPVTRRGLILVDELSLLLAELAVLATRLALKILLLLSHVLLPFYWRYPRYLAVRAPPE